MTSILAAPDAADERVEESEATSRPRLFRVPPIGWAILALIAVPTIVFAGADIFGGHLLLNGDNLIQTYPLRALVGSDIRHGVMPSWDPWIWSGTPLMAGLNAGALYPATVLFAVFNAHVAWVLGEILIFSSIGVGTCLLFDDLGMSPIAAFLGAAVFTFGGAVAAQAAVHTDMADGLASLPWILLAVRKIAIDGRWRWAVLLGGAFGFTILAGAPEAMLDIAILAIVFGLVRVSVDRSSWTRLLTRGAVGAALAVGLTAALWIPALHFIDSSQRANANISFASENAFPIPAGVLGVIPYLEGGYGLFSQPQYFGRSNLGELSFYLGILPIIAVLVMWTRAWRARLPHGEQRCWYTVLLVGIVLAISAGTPLEHLIYHIPLYGKQRDPGRNIVDVDLAASALFAWWIDGGTRRVTDRLRTSLVASFAPLAIVVAFGTWFAISPSTMWRAMRVFPPPSSARASLGDAVALAAALALVGGAIAWARRRLTRGAWIGAVGVFAAVDLALFACGSTYVVGAQTIPAPPKAGPVEDLVKANLSPQGRYAIYDPNHFDPVQLQYAAEPDVNILDQLSSISGYGAIAGATYANVTGTHVRASFDQHVLATDETAPLGVQVVVTVPESFLVPLARAPGANGSVRAVAEDPGDDPVLPGGSFGIPQRLFLPMMLAPAHTAIAAGSEVGWFFGTMLQIDRATLTLGTPDRGQLVRVGVVDPSGRVSWYQPQRLGEGQRAAHLGLPDRAGTGFVVELLHGAKLGPTRLVVASKGRSYVASGPLAPVITPANWRDVGGGDLFGVFRSSAQPKAAWVQPTTITTRVANRSRRTASTTLDSSAAVLTNRLEIGSARVVNTGQNEATIDVSTPAPGLLVWSTAWNQGWHAQVAPSGEASHEVPVRGVGLVLGVAVPKGASVVHFSYEPVGFSRGVMITFATLGAWILATIEYFAAGFWRKRRPRAA